MFFKIQPVNGNNPRKNEDLTLRKSQSCYGTRRPVKQITLAEYPKEFLNLKTDLCNSPKVHLEPEGFFYAHVRIGNPRCATCKDRQEVLTIHESSLSFCTASNSPHKLHAQKSSDIHIENRLKPKTSILKRTASACTYEELVDEDNEKQFAPDKTKYKTNVLQAIINSLSSKSIGGTDSKKTKPSKISFPDQPTKRCHCTNCPSCKSTEAPGKICEDTNTNQVLNIIDDLESYINPSSTYKPSKHSRKLEEILKSKKPKILVPRSSMKYVEIFDDSDSQSSKMLDTIPICETPCIETHMSPKLICAGISKDPSEIFFDGVFDTPNKKSSATIKTVCVSWKPSEQLLNKKERFVHCPNLSGTPSKKEYVELPDKLKEDSETKIQPVDECFEDCNDDVERKDIPEINKTSSQSKSSKSICVLDTRGFTDTEDRKYIKCPVQCKKQSHSQTPKKSHKIQTKPKSAGVLKTIDIQLPEKKRHFCDNSCDDNCAIEDVQPIKHPDSKTSNKSDDSYKSTCAVDKDEVPTHSKDGSRSSSLRSKKSNVLTFADDAIRINESPKQTRESQESKCVPETGLSLKDDDKEICRKVSKSSVRDPNDIASSSNTKQCDNRSIPLTKGESSSKSKHSDYNSAADYLKEKILKTIDKYKMSKESVKIICVNCATDKSITTELEKYIDCPNISKGKQKRDFVNVLRVSSVHLEIGKKSKENEASEKLEEPEINDKGENDLNVKDSYPDMQLEETQSLYLSPGESLMEAPSIYLSPDISKMALRKERDSSTSIKIPKKKTGCRCGDNMKCRRTYESQVDIIELRQDFQKSLVELAQGYKSSCNTGLCSTSKDRNKIPAGTFVCINNPEDKHLYKHGVHVVTCSKVSRNKEPPCTKHKEPIKEPCITKHKEPIKEPCISKHKEPIKEPPCKPKPKKQEECKKIEPVVLYEAPEKPLENEKDIEDSCFDVFVRASPEKECQEIREKEKARSYCPSPVKRTSPVNCTSTPNPKTCKVAPTRNDCDEVALPECSYSPPKREISKPCQRCAAKKNMEKRDKRCSVCKSPKKSRSCASLVYDEPATVVCTRTSRKKSKTSWESFKRKFKEKLSKCCRSKSRGKDKCNPLCPNAPVKPCKKKCKAPECPAKRDRKPPTGDPCNRVGYPEHGTNYPAVYNKQNTPDCPHRSSGYCSPTQNISYTQVPRNDCPNQMRPYQGTPVREVPSCQYQGAPVRQIPSSQYTQCECPPSKRSSRRSSASSCCKSKKKSNTCGCPPSKRSSRRSSGSSCCKSKKKSSTCVCPPPKISSRRSSASSCCKSKKKSSTCGCPPSKISSRRSSSSSCCKSKKKKSCEPKSKKKPKKKCCKSHSKDSRRDCQCAIPSETSSYYQTPSRKPSDYCPWEPPSRIPQRIDPQRRSPCRYTSTDPCAIPQSKTCPNERKYKASGTCTSNDSVKYTPKCKSHRKSQYKNEPCKTASPSISCDSVYSEPCQKTEKPCDRISPSRGVYYDRKSPEQKTENICPREMQIRDEMERKHYYNRQHQKTEISPQRECSKYSPSKGDMYDRKCPKPETQVSSCPREKREKAPSKTGSVCSDDCEYYQSHQNTKKYDGKSPRRDEYSPSKRDYYDRTCPKPEMHVSLGPRTTIPEETERTHYRPQHERASPKTSDCEYYPPHQKKEKPCGRISPQRESSYHSFKEDSYDQKCSTSKFCDETKNGPHRSPHIEKRASKTDSCSDDCEYFEPSDQKMEICPERSSPRKEYSNHPLRGDCSTIPNLSLSCECSSDQINFQENEAVYFETNEFEISEIPAVYRKSPSKESTDYKSYPEDENDRRRGKSNSPKRRNHLKECNIGELLCPTIEANDTEVKEMENSDFFRSSGKNRHFSKIPSFDNICKKCPHEVIPKRGKRNLLKTKFVKRSSIAKILFDSSSKPHHFSKDNKLKIPSHVHKGQSKKCCKNCKTCKRTTYKHSVVSICSSCSYFSFKSCSSGYPTMCSSGNIFENSSPFDYVNKRKHNFRLHSGANKRTAKKTSKDCLCDDSFSREQFIGHQKPTLQGVKLKREPKPKIKKDKVKKKSSKTSICSTCPNQKSSNLDVTRNKPSTRPKSRNGEKSGVLDTSDKESPTRTTTRTPHVSSFESLAHNRGQVRSGSLNKSVNEKSLSERIKNLLKNDKNKKSCESVKTKDCKSDHLISSRKKWKDDVSVLPTKKTSKASVCSGECDESCIYINKDFHSKPKKKKKDTKSSRNKASSNSTEVDSKKSFDSEYPYPYKKSEQKLSKKERNKTKLEPSEYIPVSCRCPPVKPSRKNTEISKKDMTKYVKCDPTTDSSRSEDCKCVIKDKESELLAEMDYTNSKNYKKNIPSTLQKKHSKTSYDTMLCPSSKSCNPNEYEDTMLKKHDDGIQHIAHIKEQKSNRLKASKVPSHTSVFSRKFNKPDSKTSKKDSKKPVSEESSSSSCNDEYCPYMTKEPFCPNATLSQKEIASLRKKLSYFDQEKSTVNKPESKTSKKEYKKDKGKSYKPAKSSASTASCRSGDPYINKKPSRASEKLSQKETSIKNKSYYNPEESNVPYLDSQDNRTKRKWGAKEVTEDRPTCKQRPTTSPSAKPTFDSYRSYHRISTTNQGSKPASKNTSSTCKKTAAPCNYTDYRPRTVCHSRKRMTDITTVSGTTYDIDTHKSKNVINNISSAKLTTKTCNDNIPLKPKCSSNKKSSVVLKPYMKSSPNQQSYNPDSSQSTRTKAVDRLSKGSCAHQFTEDPIDYSSTVKVTRDLHTKFPATSTSSEISDISDQSFPCYKTTYENYSSPSYHSKEKPRRKSNVTVRDSPSHRSFYKESPPADISPLTSLRSNKLFLNPSISGNTHVKECKSSCPSRGSGKACIPSDGCFCNNYVAYKTSRTLKKLFEKKSCLSIEDDDSGSKLVSTTSDDSFLVRKPSKYIPTQRTPYSNMSIAQANKSCNSSLSSVLRKSGKSDAVPPIDYREFIRSIDTYLKCKLDNKRESAGKQEQSPGSTKRTSPCSPGLSKTYENGCPIKVLKKHKSDRKKAPRKFNTLQQVRCIKSVSPDHKSNVGIQAKCGKRSGKSRLKHLRQKPHHMISSDMGQISTDLLQRKLEMSKNMPIVPSNITFCEDAINVVNLGRGRYSPSNCSRKSRRSRVREPKKSISSSKNTKFDRTCSPWNTAQFIWDASSHHMKYIKNDHQLKKDTGTSISNPNSLKIRNSSCFPKILTCETLMEDPCFCNVCDANGPCMQLSKEIKNICNILPKESPRKFSCIQQTEICRPSTGQLLNMRKDCSYQPPCDSLPKEYPRDFSCMEKTEIYRPSTSQLNKMRKECYQPPCDILPKEYPRDFSCLGKTEIGRPSTSQLTKMRKEAYGYNEVCRPSTSALSNLCRELTNKRSYTVPSNVNISLERPRDCTYKEKPEIRPSTCQLTKPKDPKYACYTQNKILPQECPRDFSRTEKPEIRRPSTSQLNKSCKEPRGYPQPRTSPKEFSMSSSTPTRRSSCTSCYVKPTIHKKKHDAPNPNPTRQIVYPKWSDPKPGPGLIQYKNRINSFASNDAPRGVDYSEKLLDLVRKKKKEIEQLRVKLDTASRNYESNRPSMQVSLDDSTFDGKIVDIGRTSFNSHVVNPNKVNCSLRPISQRMSFVDDPPYCSMSNFLSDVTYKNMKVCKETNADIMDSKKNKCYRRGLLPRWIHKQNTNDDSDV